MNLRSDQELDITRRKLQMLEESFERAWQDPEGGQHVRALELQSLRRIINQLKEEIVRYETRQPARR